MEMVLLFIILAIIGIVIITSSMYLITMGKFFAHIYHDLLGWHLPTKEEDCEPNGNVFHCKFCGKEIKEDDRGNWVIRN